MRQRPARRPRAIAAALALAFALGSAPAARAGGLVDAWRAARQADADLGVSRAARAASEARAAQAGTVWKPEVSLAATAGLGSSTTSVDGARFSAAPFGTIDGASFRTSVDGPTGRVALVARQPLWNPELTAIARQLELSSEGAALQWQADEQAAMLRTAERWLEVSLAAEAVRVTRRQQGSIERSLVEATDRWKAGDAPVLGTHEARARAEAVRAQLIAAETELDAREAALADLTGLPREGLRPGVPGIVAADPPAPLQQWLDEAASANPAIRAQTLAVRVATEEAARTGRGTGASVDLVATASAERITGSGDYGSSAASGATQGVIGVTLSVPLYNGGRRDARHEEALRLVDRAQAELDRTRRAVARQVRAAWLGLGAGAGRVAALEQARSASASRLSATRTGHEVGDRTTLDVLNAENDFAQAELALAQARVALLLDRLRLAALAGRLDEARLAELDAALEPAR